MKETNEKKSVLETYLIWRKMSELQLLNIFMVTQNTTLFLNYFNADNSKLEHIKIINQDIIDTFIYHFFGNCKKNIQI